MEHTKNECYEEGRVAFSKGHNKEQYPEWIKDTDNGRYQFYMGWYDTYYDKKFPDKPKKKEEVSQECEGK
jgi:hypothetical protein